MNHDAPAIERLGIPAYNWWSECLHGAARNGTATVFPPASRAPKCAQLSIPRAIPLTMANPARDNADANLRAVICPYTEQLREPIIDMHGIEKSKSPIT